MYRATKEQPILQEMLNLSLHIAAKYRHITKPCSFSFLILISLQRSHKEKCLSAQFLIYAKYKLNWLFLKGKPNKYSHTKMSQWELRNCNKNYYWDVINHYIAKNNFLNFLHVANVTNVAKTYHFIELEFISTKK